MHNKRLSTSCYLTGFIYYSDFSMIYYNHQTNKECGAMVLFLLGFLFVFGGQLFKRPGPGF